MTASRLIDQDMGWKRLKRDLTYTKEATVVTVGVQGDAAKKQHGDDGISNVALAAVHEYGRFDGTIPERSFIRSTIDDRSEEYHRLAKNLCGRIIDGTMTTHRALAMMGTRIVVDIKRRIQRGIDPPNKPATISRKRSSKPLIDKGQLIGSITHEVGTNEGA